MLFTVYDVRPGTVRGMILRGSLSVVLLAAFVILAVRPALPSVSEASATSCEVVILDAGHGGEDNGASVDGVREKDLNLLYADTLGMCLSDLGYAVIYTRTEDRLLYDPATDPKGKRKIADLRNRCAVAETYPGALFISLHMNSYPSASPRGTQIYYGVGSEDSRHLAECIRTAVIRDLQQGNRRAVKEGRDIYLTEHIATPVVLIECGFMTNPQELRELGREEYRMAFCRSVAKGIENYRNG